MTKMFDQELSDKIKKLIKAGDIEGFKSIEEITQYPNAFLFSKIRKNAHPLIKAALSGDFTNRNYKGRLEIANYLLKLGANPNVCAPYGQTGLESIMHTHSWLRITKAKYDVYLHTLAFVIEMVRSYDIDVNLRGTKSDDYHLNKAIDIYYYHRYYVEEEFDENLVKLALTLVEELLMRGAVGEDIEDEIERNKLNEIQALVDKYAGNEPFPYVPKATEMTDFGEFLEGQVLDNALALWQDKDSPVEQALNAVKVLYDRAFLHANWVYSDKEQQAEQILELRIAEMDKEKQKEPKKLLKQIMNKKKVCYDEVVYQELYKVFIC